MMQVNAQTFLGFCALLSQLFDFNVKPVSHLILKISFLTLFGYFGYTVKITLDINQILYGWMNR